jgi:putative transposase
MTWLMPKRSAKRRRGQICVLFQSKAPKNKLRPLRSRRVIANLFYIPRHNILSPHHRELQAAAMLMWRDIARLQAA